MKSRIVASTALLALTLASGLEAQKAAPKAPQKIDEEYTRTIKENLQDPRISTELVDHLPASDTVPSPLKFLGRAVGAPGELTYAKDIYRYYEALAKAAPTRAKYWKVGTTEEGRDIVLLAVGSEDSIKNLDKYRDMLGELTDPRRTTEARAQQLLHTAKPIYYAISGMHSPETGGPEMLIELAYRLIVEETPFVQNIRNNVITLITPVIEVDGREKQVDTYYFNKKRAQGDARLPLMYWGKYVQHDNNRDGMGQFLKLTQAVTKETLEWHPTVIHDLHEAQTYLYSSTGTGPYNNDIDPIVVSEWWTLAPLRNSRGGEAPLSAALPGGATSDRSAPRSWSRRRSATDDRLSLRSCLSSFLQPPAPLQRCALAPLAPDLFPLLRRPTRTRSALLLPQQHLVVEHRVSERRRHLPVELRLRSREIDARLLIAPITPGKPDRRAAVPVLAHARRAVTAFKSAELRIERAHGFLVG
jgi:hypothetical protein